MPRSLTLLFVGSVLFVCVIQIYVLFRLPTPVAPKRLLPAQSRPPIRKTVHRPTPTEPWPQIGLTKDGSIEPVLNILSRAGVTVPEDRHKDLPSWLEISQLYGDAPVIVGLEHCQAFRAAVPGERRMLGAAGLFSTGTNLLTRLLKANCQIPERVKVYGPNATKEELGMRWQV